MCGITQLLQSQVSWFPVSLPTDDAKRDYDDVVDKAPIRQRETERTTCSTKVNYVQVVVTAAA